jgi:hypothetical protein
MPASKTLPICENWRDVAAKLRADFDELQDGLG